MIKIQRVLVDRWFITSVLIVCNNLGNSISIKLKPRIKSQTIQHQVKEEEKIRNSLGHDLVLWMFHPTWWFSLQPVNFNLFMIPKLNTVIFWLVEGKQWIVALIINTILTHYLTHVIATSSVYVLCTIHLSRSRTGVEAPRILRLWLRHYEWFAGKRYFPPRVLRCRWKFNTYAFTIDCTPHAVI